MLVQGQRLGRKKAWEEWVEDWTDREELLKSHERSVPKHSRQKFEEGSMPTGYTDDSSSARPETEEEEEVE